MRVSAGTMAQGAIDGVLATAPMTALMVGARWSGALRELPPQTITTALLDRASVDPSPPTTSMLAAANHLAYGAACGALYAAGARTTTWTGGTLLGIAFGAAVWLASYQGWVPAAGILPPASRDRPGRPAAMLAAHAAFGAVLGALTTWRRRRERARKLKQWFRAAPARESPAI